MKNPDRYTKKYIQTDIISFSNEIKDESISLIKINLVKSDISSQLKKVAQYRQIKKEFFSFNEWQRILGKDWKSFENNKYFISDDHSMIVGNLSNYDDLMTIKKISKTFRFLKEINNLEEIVRFNTKSSDSETVQLNGFLYTCNTIEKGYKILEKPILIYQNEQGLLVGKNLNVFMLMAPIIY